MAQDRAGHRRGGVKRVLWLLQFPLLVYLGLGAVLYLAQRSFIYFPVPENGSTDYPVEYLENAGARLKVWVVNPGQRRAAVYLGGNAEDVYFNAAYLERHLPGHTAYLLNYRGYGGSSGKPSEAALFSDALALFDRVQGRHDGVAAIGRSLGSAVATHLAARRPVERLVLVTPPDSALALAQRMYPVYPLGWLLEDRFDSVSDAPAVRVPVLLLVAARDRVVPRATAERLAAAFGASPPETVVVPGAGHNDISAAAGYWQAIGRFLGEAAID